MSIRLQLKIFFLITRLVIATAFKAKVLSYWGALSHSWNLDIFLFA